MNRTIPARESLAVEFKSDRDRLPDSELIHAVVGLANTDGGELYLGMEDDGTISGLHPTHDDPAGLAALVGNRTIPPLSVRVERLVEAGLAEPHGATRGRTYTLSARVYARLGQKGNYVRQVGFDQLQQEQMVLEYVEAHGTIRRREVVELCRISDDQAKRLLQRLVAEERLARTGERRSACYGRRPNPMGATDPALGGPAPGPSPPGQREPNDSRQTGARRRQQEQRVLEHVEAHGTIRRREVVELCRISDNQAKRLLQRLVAQERLVRTGEKSAARYGRHPKIMGAPELVLGDAPIPRDPGRREP